MTETIEILRGLRDGYEAHHQVRFTDEALVAAAELSDRYIADRFLPDKAIDLIDQAGARVRLRMGAPASGRRETEQRLEQVRRDKEQAVADEDFERASSAARRDPPADRRAGRTAPASDASAASEAGRTRGRAVRDRRGGVPGDRHPGHPAHRGGAGPAAAPGGPPARAGGRSGRGGRRGGRGGPPVPGRARRPATGRSAASSSSARPGSARPNWPARWPRRCSATGTGWCAWT